MSFNNMIDLKINPTSQVDLSVMVNRGSATFVTFWFVLCLKLEGGLGCNRIEIQIESYIVTIQGA